MHDGVQKFSHELNGVFLRTVCIDDDGLQIVNIPWGLTEIQGGSLNSKQLEKHLLKTIANAKPSSENAYSKFIEAQRNSGVSDELQIQIPPEYFKCCTLDNVNFEPKEILLVSDSWPVGIMGDGCSVNSCASDKLTNVFGLMSPSARCGSHAAEGTLNECPNRRHTQLQR